MQDKIKTIDWEIAKTDVRPFLRPDEAASLDLWGEEFFEVKVEKLLRHF